MKRRHVLLVFGSLLSPPSPFMHRCFETPLGVRHRWKIVTQSLQTPQTTIPPYMCKAVEAAAVIAGRCSCLFLEVLKACVRTATSSKKRLHKKGLSHAHCQQNSLQARFRQSTRCMVSSMHFARPTKTTSGHGKCQKKI